MNLTLQVKGSEKEKDVKVLEVENKVMSKDIKILTKNVAKLEKIQIVREKTAEKLSCASSKNTELKITKENLVSRANQLMRELVV